MPHRQDAVAPILPQILAEPGLLGGSGPSIHVAINRHDMPVAIIQAVIPLSRSARGSAEVSVIRQRTARLILMIAGCGPRSILEAPPRRLIASLKIVCRASGIGIVACGEDEPRKVFDQ